MFEFDDRRNRLAAHVFDRILVAEPVRASDCVEHVPAPVVLRHVAERRADAALRRDGVAARREYLGDAGRIEPGGDHSQRRPQTGPPGAEDDDIKGMVDNVVTVRH